MFEEAGHQVALAVNGLQGLAALCDPLPDFIVLDVAMPVMSGKGFVLEMGNRALQDPRLASIPFVVMTGEDTMERELNEVFSASPGFICFFPKMVPPEQVVAKAVEVLGG